MVNCKGMGRRRKILDLTPYACENEKRYRALVQATECHKAAGRVGIKGQSDGVMTLRNSEFWNLVEGVGSIRLPHCHGSTINPVASNPWSLSHDWGFRAPWSLPCI